MKDKNEKKEIEEDVYYSFGVDSLNGTLQEVANNILSFENMLRTEHQGIINEPDKYLYFKMRIADYYDSPEIQLSGVRMETDVEYARRMKHNENSRKGQIASAQKRKEKKEAEELKTLKRLQEKYKDKL